MLTEQQFVTVLPSRLRKKEEEKEEERRYTSESVGEDDSSVRKTQTDLYYTFYDILSRLHLENEDVIQASLDQCQFLSEVMNVSLYTLANHEYWRGHLAICLFTSMKCSGYFRTYRDIALLFNTSLSSMLEAEKEQEKLHLTDLTPMAKPSKSVDCVCAWLNFSFPFTRTAKSICLALEAHFANRSSKVILTSLLIEMVRHLPANSPDKDKIDLESLKELKEVFRFNRYIPQISLPATVIEKFMRENLLI